MFVLTQISQSELTELDSASFDNRLVKFRCDPVSEEELEKLISKFENNYSTDYDGVPITVIKHIQDHLVITPTYLINSPSVSGIYPDKLKISKTKNKNFTKKLLKPQVNICY